MTHGAKLQDEFGWRERINSMNCGVFNCDEAHKLMNRFSEMVLKGQLDAKKYGNEAKKAAKRAQVYPTESGRAYWMVREPILRRIAEELQQRADEWEMTVGSLATLLGRTSEAQSDRS